jgi:signal transduction histidine kinase
MAPAGAVPERVIDDVLDILSRPGDSELEEIVELVARTCDAEAAGITIRKDDEYQALITHGILPLTCSADDTFCQFTMTTDGVYAIEDARRDPRFADIGWVDGRLAHVRFYASAPIYASAGQMLGRLCVIDSAPKQPSRLQLRSLEMFAFSITKLIELRLLQRNRAVTGREGQHAADTVLGQLGAELSHDLRVPLAAIVASVEMLEEALEEHTDPAVDALLERTMRSAERMTRMLDQGMRFNHRNEERQVGDVDLGKVTDQLIRDSAHLVSEYAADVDVGPLPVVRADADEMYSVLQNLLTNAVKYTRPGVSPEVRIRARPSADGWRISVIDNGTGIPEDRRVDVFSLFTRATGAVPGHGIGLATVARLVKNHDGRVGIDSVPAGGSEVWFELPSR